MCSVGERGIFTQLLVVTFFRGCINHSRSKRRRKSIRTTSPWLLVAWSRKGF